MLVTGVDVLSGAYQMLTHKRALARFTCTTVEIIHSRSTVIRSELRDIPQISHSLVKI